MHHVVFYQTGPYSSFSISCSKQGSGIQWRHFDAIIVNNSGVINALKTGFGLQMQ